MKVIDFLIANPFIYDKSLREVQGHRRQDRQMGAVGQRPWRGPLWPHQVVRVHENDVRPHYK